MCIRDSGKLAHHLLSPKHHVRKTYYVEHQLCLDETAIKTLCNGSIILDEKTVLCAALEAVSYTHLDVYKRQEYEHRFMEKGQPIYRAIWKKYPMNEKNA